MRVSVCRCLCVSVWMGCVTKDVHVPTTWRSGPRYSDFLVCAHSHNSLVVGIGICKSEAGESGSMATQCTLPT